MVEEVVEPIDDIEGELEKEEGEGLMGYLKLIALLVLIGLIFLVGIGLLKFWMVGSYGGI